ncbi:uncharacterized protein LOC108917318 [Anoplophora glabripennis]|uniref:uncharacterized protein LOC108917318 n=1 Tax=Anoplophora glabripennis TaxID=217634 RepID=UPI00087392AC|nr:uncharacterized protein LOC108917318 [Anoplophora glabripennis]
MAEDIKTIYLQDIQKESLHVVLQQLNFVNCDHKNRTNIIKELVCSKKKLLKLNESAEDSDSESESHKKIVTLLEKERNIIFDETNMKLEEINLEKQKILSEKVIFPVIPKRKMDHMLSLLKFQKKLGNEEKKLMNCLSHIQSSAKPPWNSPSIIFKAIKDSIIRRKWENLTKLLLMLIHFPSVKYKPTIRHMCKILDKYHPVIRHRGLQDQFDMITLTNKGSKIGNSKLV